MKRKYVPFLILLFCINMNYATDVLDFNKEFNMAIKDITMGRTSRALPRLLDLSKEDPTNANLHYLIGLCYTENAENPEEAIRHLEMAEKSMVRDYMVHSYQEKRVPVYVYYYLALAYAQNGECSKAAIAKEHFFKNYKIYTDDDYYIVQAENSITECINKTGEEKIPEKQMPLLEAEKVEISGPSGSTDYLEHRLIRYNMNTSVYGVQIGAFSKDVSQDRYAGLKNIRSFLGTDGTIRYVVGHFNLQTQADELRRLLASKGFSDAFVVDISKEKKFSDAVLNLDYSAESKYAGGVDLRVQIGAFKEKITQKDLRKYLEIDGIKEVRCGDLTLLTVGSFDHYKDAVKLRDELIRQGNEDAFVAAFNKDTRIPLQEAINYLKSTY